MALAFCFSSPFLAVSRRLHLQPVHFGLVSCLCPPSCTRKQSSRRMCSDCHSSSFSSASPSDSWIPVVNSDDKFRGWFVALSEGNRGGTGDRKLFVAAIGASVVIMLVSMAHFSLSKKGFSFQLIAPFQPIMEVFRRSRPAKTLNKEIMINTQEAAEKMEDKTVVPQSVSEHVKYDIKSGKKGYKIVPVSADSNQQRALTLLQELKIVEDDAKPYELCTRREYARWLVKTNSLLERDPKHRIVPSILIAGSTTSAFDDVDSSDPDFMFIQAIGESGLVPSRLSVINNLELDNNSCPMGKYVFSPESLISRIDLISWKAKLEYPLAPEAEEKMLRKNIGFMDLGTVNMDVLQALFMDTLAGERSILGRVFGNIRLLQPQKPITKAQVAVALTSGRMADAARIEVSRMEAERLSKLVNSKEIMTELIHKGDIPRFWDQKINEEKIRGLDIQKELVALSQNLAEEKIAYEQEITDHIKEKAALDCQWQLLSGLKEEVDRMTERVVNDKMTVVAEQSSLEELLAKLHEEQNATFEAKSILEAEKEALRILRSWVEDGARRSQFRAKVLEDAVQRWKWDGQAGLSKNT